MSSITLITAPEVEPVSLAEAKLACRVDVSDADSLILASIQAARGAAEGLTRRALITQTWELALDCFPEWIIYVPKPTLQSVISIKYIDDLGVVQTLPTDQYIVDSASMPGRITPAFGATWPTARWQINAVMIRFVAGYGLAAAVPQGIKMWMNIRIKHMFDNPDMVLIGTRTQISEFPRMVVDGMLDEYAVQNFNWET